MCFGNGNEYITFTTLEYSIISMIPCGYAVSRYITVARQLFFRNYWITFIVYSFPSFV